MRNCVYVYAYMGLRNLQERIETWPTEILTNVAGRSSMRVAGRRHRRRGSWPAAGPPSPPVPSWRSYRMLPTCCSICTVPSASRRFQSWHVPFTHICGCGCVDMCGCAVERLCVYARAPAGASAPTMVSVSGELSPSRPRGPRRRPCRGGIPRPPEGREDLPGAGGDGGQGPGPHLAVALGHLLHVDDSRIEGIPARLRRYRRNQSLDDRVLGEEVCRSPEQPPPVCWKRTGSEPLIGVVDERRRLLPAVGVEWHTKTSPP